MYTLLLFRSLLFALLAVRFMVRFLLIDPARCLLRLHSAVCSQQHAARSTQPQPQPAARALSSIQVVRASPSDALL